MQWTNRFHLTDGAACVGTPVRAKRYRCEGTNIIAQVLAVSDPDRPIVKRTNEARQAVTGHNVRYVLAISLVAAVLALGVLWGVSFGH